MYIQASFLLEAYVIIRVLFRLDPAIYFILAAYLAFITRLPPLSGEGMNLISGLGIQLIYGLLYFFVFEMLRLRLKLEKIPAIILTPLCPSSLFNCTPRLLR